MVNKPLASIAFRRDEELTSSLLDGVLKMNMANENARLEALLGSLEQPVSDWERKTIIHWTSIIGHKDPYYAGHVANVCEWVRALGKALHLSDYDGEKLVRGALVHDIGKIDVPEPILAKPGPLTEAERSSMQNYCIVGQELVESLPSFRDVGFLVRSHHERLDGSGYPDGLESKVIPVLLRILTVADVFDAIRSERVYKSAQSDEETLAALLDEADRNWLDRDVVAALKSLVTRPTAPPSERNLRRTRGAAERSPALVDPTAEDPIEVLVVEDNDALRNMIATIAGTMGLTVHKASNGWQALERLRLRASIGIVLLDIMMPDMDGFAFCHALREDPTLRERAKSLHIIIVSARTGSEDKIRGLQLGAADYLTKPFDSRELRARISVGERLVRQQRVLEAQRSLLEEMVRVEPLTGICSRRFFEQLLRDEWTRARRYHHPVSLVMADLDHFKRVNDHYGHACGDSVLSRVGQLLRDDVREPDVVARYGGEEFVLLLPETGSQGAHQVAERVRQAVREEVFRHPEGEFRVTMSCGVATVEDPGGSSTADLLHAADRALYKAKLGGRDQIR